MSDNTKIQKTAFAIANIEFGTGDIKIGDETNIRIGQSAHLLMPDGQLIRTSIVSNIRRDPHLVITTHNSEYRIICEKTRI